MTTALPTFRFAVLLALLLPLSVTAAQRYEISARVWIDGELRGTPTLMVEPEKTANIEVSGHSVDWRMSVLVEAPGPSEAADPGGIWMAVGLDRKVDGSWEHLTETLIGTPLGEPGRISVTGSGAAADAAPEQAQLHVEFIARELNEAQRSDR
jgi:hypothetical protein